MRRILEAEYYNLEQVQAMFGKDNNGNWHVSIKRLRAFIRDGDLKACRPGRTYLVHVDHLRELQDSISVNIPRGRGV